MYVHKGHQSKDVEQRPNDGNPFAIVVAKQMVRSFYFNPLVSQIFG